MPPAHRVDRRTTPRRRPGPHAGSWQRRIVLAGGVLTAMAAWLVLVLQAIAFGQNAGSTLSWVLLGLATLGAIACMFLAILLATRLVGLLRPPARRPVPPAPRTTAPTPAVVPATPRRAHASTSGPSATATSAPAVSGTHDAEIDASTTPASDGEATETTEPTEPTEVAAPPAATEDPGSTETPTPATPTPTTPTPATPTPATPTPTPSASTPPARTPAAPTPPTRIAPTPPTASAGEGDPVPDSQEQQRPRAGMPSRGLAAVRRRVGDGLPERLSRRLPGRSGGTRRSDRGD